MTLTSSIHGRTMPSTVTDGDLSAVRRDLLGRGWDARLVGCRTCGELDERLEIRRARSPVVELLGPCADAPCGSRWQAVRITPYSRVVWCGPPRSCAAPELVGFVEDLLGPDPEQLTGRYARLG